MGKLLKWAAVVIVVIVVVGLISTMSNNNDKDSGSGDAKDQKTSSGERQKDGADSGKTLPPVRQTPKPSLDTIACTIEQQGIHPTARGPRLKLVAMVKNNSDHRFKGTVRVTACDVTGGRVDSDLIFFDGGIGPDGMEKKAILWFKTPEAISAFKYQASGDFEAVADLGTAGVSFEQVGQVSGRPFFFIYTPKQDRASLEKIIAAYRKRHPNSFGGRLRLYFFNDKSKAARKFPMDDAAMSCHFAMYGWNKRTNWERLNFISGSEMAKYRRGSGSSVTPTGRVDPLALAVGKSYRLSRETPLMPEFEPADPIAATGRVKHVPSGGTITVRSVRIKGTTVKTPWYEVAAADSRGRVIGKGWVSSLALLGQTIAPVGPSPTTPATSGEIARGKMGLARSYISAGMKDKAKAILEGVVKEHPKTDAAEEAGELLKGLE